jgi:hypothetical protein
VGKFYHRGRGNKGAALRVWTEFDRRTGLAGLYRKEVGADGVILFFFSSVLSVSSVVKFPCGVGLCGFGQN